MSNPESKSIVELTGSVTKDGAVALLLGWAVDPVRSAIIHLDRFGIIEDQFRTLPSMDQSVQEILTEQLQDAENWGEFAVSIDNYKDADEAGAKIEYWKEKITKAQGYLRDIAAELALGNDSKLKYATPDFVSDERILITLDSLDRWAKKKYKFSIQAGRPLSDRSVFDDDSAELQEFGPLKVKNLQTTLALMVDLFASLGAPYSKVDQGRYDADPGFEDAIPNAIAAAVVRRAELKFGKGSPDVQMAQTVRKQLSLAMNVLSEKLK